MGVIDSLFVKLGYQYDKSQLDGFNNRVTRTISLLKGTALSVIGLAGTFGYMFKRLSLNALAQDRFGRSMGESRKTIEAFKRISEELTGESGTGAGILSRFNDFFNNLAAGNVNPQMLRSLAELGIEFDKFKKLNPSEAALMIAEGMQKADKQTQNVITSLLGLSGAEKIFLQGLKRRDLSDLTPSDLDLKKIEEFDKKIIRLRKSFEDFVVKIGNLTLDPISKGIEKITNSIDPLMKKLEMFKSSTEESIINWLVDKIELGSDFKINREKIESDRTNVSEKNSSKINIKEESFHKIENSEKKSKKINVIEENYYILDKFFEKKEESIERKDFKTTDQESSSTTVNQEMTFNISSNNPVEVGEEIKKVLFDSFKNIKGNRTNPIIS